MFRSADRLASGAALGALLLLAASAPAWSEETGGADEPTVAEYNDAPVDQAPIVDLDTPVIDLEAPVMDLVHATTNEDGSLTDAEEDEERVLTLAADVLFDYDEAELTSDADDVLDEAAEVLTEAEDETVSIDGYTDSHGGDSYNLELSLDRAEAVEEALDERLPDAGTTFDVDGHGSADPVAPNEVDGEDNPEGREENRRVEIRIDGE